MPDRELTVAVGGGSISALWTVPESGGGDCFVYAPGAGSNLSDGFGEYLAGRLAEAGMACVRFQFPYMEAARRGPNPPRVLEETWLRVVETVRAETASRIVAGGRSMGGRYASLMAAKAKNVDALALFAYPLHPPGNPERPRDGHFPGIAVPTFFCSGTRDSFGTPEELRAAAAEVPNAALHFLESADHGFAVPRSTGRTRDGVWAEAAEAFLSWYPHASNAFNGGHISR